MASRRMIDPTFWRSETMAQLTRDQRLLFIGLVSNADDQGRLRAHPALIRSDVYPFEDEPLDKIAADLEAIAGVGSISIYEAEGRRYIQIVNWWTYQRPKWAWPSEMPPPNGWQDRLRYRIGNQAVRENWDDDGGVEPEPPRDDGETGMKPPRNGNETTAKPTPRTSDRNRTRTSDEDAPQAAQGANAPVPDPSELTVKEIRSLELPDEKWREMLAREREGKNRAGALRHIRAALNRPPPAVLIYRTTAERFPKKALWDGIDKAVGRDEADLAFWERVVKNYVACGWNEGNIKLMLEYFGRREIPSTTRGRDNGRTTGRTGSTTGGAKTARHSRSAGRAGQPRGSVHSTVTDEQVQRKLKRLRQQRAGD